MATVGDKIRAGLPDQPLRPDPLRGRVRRLQRHSLERARRDLGRAAERDRARHVHDGRGARVVTDWAGDPLPSSSTACVHPSHRRPGPEGATLHVEGEVRGVRDDGLVDIDLTATVNGQTVLAKAKVVAKPPASFSGQGAAGFCPAPGPALPRAGRALWRAWAWLCPRRHAVTAKPRHTRGNTRAARRSASGQLTSHDSAPAHQLADQVSCRRPACRCGRRPRRDRRRRARTTSAGSPASERFTRDDGHLGLFEDHGRQFGRAV